MTVLAALTVLAVLESTLPSFCLSYKIQHKEATVAVLAVMAVSVIRLPPLKLNPTFSVILIRARERTALLMIKDAFHCIE